MSKKLLSSVIVAVLLIVAAFTVAACQDPSVLELYGGVADAKNIVQQITVKTAIGKSRKKL